MALHDSPILTPGNSVGERVRQARRARDMSQGALAKRIGASRESISHWENGRYSPTVEDLLLIADALTVPPGWFLDGLGPHTVTQRYRATLKAA